MRTPEIDLHDRYRRALVGCGIGDAMGSPVEGWQAERISRVFGRLKGYLPRPDGILTPRLTDDTQLTLCLASSIVESGGVDPEDLARRFDAWLYIGRGVGASTREAIMRYRQGLPWDQAGVPSAGNGAAMRAAPLGLLHRKDLDALRRGARLASIVTHNDPAAVASAVVMGFGVAYLTAHQPGTVTPEEFLGAVVDSFAGMDDPAYPLRHVNRRMTLRQRLEQVADYLDATPEEAFAVTHNGAFVLESLPAAIWAFVTNLDDPTEAILTAVNGGYDADTVGAMTGALAGAYHGVSAFPPDWVWPLEYADGLAGWADEILRLNGLADSGRETLRCAASNTTHGWGLFKVEGKSYPTVEHAFRSITALDPVDQERIRIAPTPYDAEQAARAVVLNRDTWDRRTELLANLKTRQP